MPGSSHALRQSERPDQARLLAVEGAVEDFRTDDGDRCHPHTRIARISRQLERVQVFAVEFDEANWPQKFDLGDDFPNHHFENGQYVGPQFVDLVRPATFATKERADEKGKKYCIPSAAFLGQWLYSVEDMLYVNKHIPKLTYTADRLNKALKPFQHDPKIQVSGYIDTSDISHVDLFDYRPDMSARKVAGRMVRQFNEDGKRRFNTFQPTPIKATQGDTAIFHDYLNFVVADPDERQALKRWLFTLIGRPAIRMGFGVLIVSKETGTGKSTLGENIVIPLVGHDNCSTPTSDEIDSQFSGWITGNRLAFINEMYIGGQTRKTTGRLKTIITDRHVRVNEKYEKAKGVLNFVHLLACSNDIDALSLDAQDRRWFVPRWTEARWHRLHELRQWAKSGGLSALLFEAQTQADDFYVQPYEIAPHTERKRQVVDSSLSKILGKVMALSDAVQGEEKDNDRKVCVLADTLEFFIEDGEKGPIPEWDDNRARVELLKGEGWLYTGQHEKGIGTLDGYQPKISGKKRNVVISPEAKEEILAAGNDNRAAQYALINSYLVDLHTLDERYGSPM